MVYGHLIFLFVYSLFWKSGHKRLRFGKSRILRGYFQFLFYWSALLFYFQIKRKLGRGNRSRFKQILAVFFPCFLYSVQIKPSTFDFLKGEGFFEKKKDNFVPFSYNRIFITLFMHLIIGGFRFTKILLIYGISIFILGGIFWTYMNTTETGPFAPVALILFFLGFFLVMLSPAMLATSERVRELQQK